MATDSQTFLDAYNRAIKAGASHENALKDAQLYVKNAQGTTPTQTGADGATYNYAGDALTAPTTDTSGGSGGGAAADPNVAMAAAIKQEIKARGGDIQAAYDSLYGDLNTLLTSRDSQLTTQYGGQRTKATENYTDALPAIDQSYAALGSYDSTQRGDSRGKAKKGFEDTLGTIGTNEQADRAKLGQYGNEQRAKFGADKAAAERNVARVDETTDVNALRGLRNDLETNLGTTGVTRATLTADGQAGKDLNAVTGDNGRYQAATDALDSILKSSLASDVKAAAVTAVTDSAGLSETDKKKIQQTYGNVYSEQAAL